MDIKIEETENSLKIIKSISILKMKLKNIMVGDIDWIRDKSNYLNGK